MQNVSKLFKLLECHHVFTVNYFWCYHANTHRMTGDITLALTSLPQCQIIRLGLFIYFRCAALPVSKNVRNLLKICASRCTFDRKLRNRDLGCAVQTFQSGLGYMTLGYICYTHSLSSSVKYYFHHSQINRIYPCYCEIIWLFSGCSCKRIIITRCLYICSVRLTEAWKDFIKLN